METELSGLEPGLYIVAGPIGNLGDLTPRAADILRRADVIAVEDTRVSARLLRHAGSDRPMLPYHDHSADHVRQRLVENEISLAHVPDAGKATKKRRQQPRAVRKTPNCALGSLALRALQPFGHSRVPLHRLA